MKKVFTLMVLLMAALIGAGTIDAKTTKKKSSSSSSVSFGEFYDGYPNINGHTYSGTIQGYKLTVAFSDFNGRMGEVDIKASYRGQWERELNNWYYEGDGIIMFYMDGGNPVYFEVTNGGKSLYNEESGISLKLVK